MGSVPMRTVLVVWGMVLVTPVAPGSRVASAQPGARSTAPANAGARSTARKLVEDGIAAYGAKDYGKAIALYMRAFSLDPHPRLLFNVAQALRLAGCTERARAFYERYLTLEPQGGESATARDVLTEIKRRRSSGPSRSGPAGAESCSVADSLMDAQPADPAEAKGRLRLNSKPEGVTAMLDGAKIGATPIDREVAAGAHMVSLVYRDRLMGEQRVEVDANEVAEVTIPVVLTESPSRTVSYALFGVASVALVVSGYMFYLGQQGDGPKDQFEYPYANRTGLVLVGVGAAAIGAGIWLWIREPRERSSAPVAAITSGGGYFGWQGRF